MKLVAGETYECYQCGHTWPSDKAHLGFYMRDRITGPHIVQPCKYCRCRNNKRRYKLRKRRSV